MELEPYYINVDLMRSAAKQFSKDLGTGGKEMEFSGNPSLALAEFSRQAEPQIRELFEKDYEKLSQFMYRVDVSEKELKYVLENSVAAELMQSITMLVIRRCLQKAITRKVYKP